ncbi:hypothetical protein JaAD80_08190 [Janthinobacterium sp. AD80]|nr:hypothetical protein JaAD80_08190 [Janthinobacterium sp. AD80]
MKRNAFILSLDLRSKLIHTNFAHECDIERGGVIADLRKFSQFAADDLNVRCQGLQNFIQASSDRLALCGRVASEISIHRSFIKLNNCIVEISVYLQSKFHCGPIRIATKYSFDSNAKTINAINNDIQVFPGSLSYGYFSLLCGIKSIRTKSFDYLKCNHCVLKVIAQFFRSHAASLAACNVCGTSNCSNGSNCRHPISPLLSSQLDRDTCRDGNNEGVDANAPTVSLDSHFFSKSCLKGILA